MAEQENNNSSGLSSILPVVGSALDFGSSLLGGLFNANQAKKNRAFQERMYKQQVEDSKQMWLMQQAYNLPSAQIQRLKDAGLNPLLMYGQGGTSLTASSQAQLPSAPSGAQGSMSAHTNFGQGLAQAALLHAQIRNMNADSEKKEAEAEQSKQTTKNLTFDLAFKMDTAELQKANMISQYDLNKSMESLNREQRYYYRDACKKLGAEIQACLSDMENKKAMTATQINDINTRLDKFLEEFPHMIANLDSQTRKNYADAFAARVSAMFQKELIDSGYIDILVGEHGQSLLNAIKEGDALTIENGLKGLEFMSKPKPGSFYYKSKNFFEYVAKPAVEVLEDAAIGAGALYMLKGTKAPLKVKGFAP